MKDQNETDIFGNGKGTPNWFLDSLDNTRVENIPRYMKSVWETDKVKWLRLLPWATRRILS